MRCLSIVSCKLAEKRLWGGNNQNDIILERIGRYHDCCHFSYLVIDLLQWWASMGLLHANFGHPSCDNGFPGAGCKSAPCTFWLPMDHECAVRVLQCVLLGFICLDWYQATNCFAVRDLVVCVDSVKKCPVCYFQVASPKFEGLHHSVKLLPVLRALDTQPRVTIACDKQLVTICVLFMGNSSVHDVCQRLIFTLQCSKTERWSQARHMRHKWRRGESGLQNPGKIWIHLENLTSNVGMHLTK